jgi:hypothetical protein
VTCSRIVPGTADVLLAADEVVAVSKEAITLCDSQRTNGVINTHLIPIADRCNGARRSSISPMSRKRCSAIPSPPT